MNGSTHMPTKKLNTNMIVALAVVMMALFVFCVTYFARVSYAGSDPKYSLLVSQSILENRTIKLDAYVEKANLSGQDINLIQYNGHLYYYFPLGTSVFVLPFVWLANSLGIDFSEVGNDFAFQALLSAIICSLIFVMLFLNSRTLLNDTWGLLIASLTTLGSGFVSTLGTALWNQNLASLFVLVSILLLLRLPEYPSKAFWPPYALGVFLFAAFFCRPTTATFIGCTLVYLLIWHRPYFVKTAAIALLLLSGWLAFCFLEYGQILAPYYSMSRLRLAASPLAISIYGQLFSPSRGVFVFSPFLLFALCAILLDFDSYRNERLIYYSLIWFAIHIVVVSVGDNVPWWGGHSFGPRLLVDALPALFLLSVVFFKHICDNSYGRRRKNAVFLIYITLGGIGFLINSVQGLYNGNTARWNGKLFPPDPGIHNTYLFSWQYPQFAATKSNLCERHRKFLRSQLRSLESKLSMYDLGESIGYQADEQRALFIGWSIPQSGWRWTECADVEVIFGPVEIGDLSTLELDLMISSQTKQTITVSMNDVVIGNIEIRKPSTQPQHFRISLNSSLLRETNVNRLSLHVPEVRGLIGDPHVLGLKFTEFGLAATSAE